MYRTAWMQEVERSRMPEPRMYGHDICSVQIISTYVHAGNIEISGAYFRVSLNALVKQGYSKTQ